MKHAYLSLFCGLALLVPHLSVNGALAQTGEGEEETPSADEAGDEGSSETEEGESSEDTEASEESETTETTEGEAESTTDAPPEPEPEPEISATEESTEDASGEAAELTEPSVEDDIADATEAETDVEAEEGDDEEEEDEGPKLPWRSSAFLWDHSVSTATLDGGSGLTYNPTYSMAFSFRPRWYLTDDISVRGRQDFSYELTDTDLRAVNREFVVADTRLDIAHANVYEYEGATLALAGRLYLPTSKASRFQNMILRTGVSTSVSRPFEEVLGGLTLGVASSFTYRLSGTNVGTIDPDDAPYAPRVASAGLTDSENIQVGGASTTVVDGTIGLSAEMVPLESLSDLSVSTSFTWWWNQGRGLADACLDSMSTVVSSSSSSFCIEDGSDTHTRLLTWFTAGVAYGVTDWVSAELGYSHLTGEFNPDGSRRNPFWSLDSLVSLTATVVLDKLYLQFTETEVEAEVADDEDSERRQTAAARRNRRAQ